METSSSTMAIWEPRAAIPREPSVTNQSDPGDALAALDTLLRLLQNQAPQTPELERAEREFHKVRNARSIIADEMVDQGKAVACGSRPES